MVANIAAADGDGEGDNSIDDGSDHEMRCMMMIKTMMMVTTNDSYNDDDDDEVMMM